MEYDEYGNEKNEMWYILDDIEKRNLGFQEIREELSSLGLQYEKNNDKLERIIQKAIVSYMDENKVDIKYYEYIYKEFYNTPLLFDDFFDSKVESEEEINSRPASIR